MYECSKNCPACGGKVEWDFACHTYPQTSCPVGNRDHRVKWWSDENIYCVDCDLKARVTWMACMPCDSATQYICQAHNEDRCDSDCAEWNEHEGCGWRWTWGLNPDNPRAVDNETRNPRWGENEME